MSCVQSAKVRQAMTVKELIEHLQTLPQDYLVVYQRYSDLTKLEASDILVAHACDRSVVQHHNQPDLVREYREHEWNRKLLTPHFLDAVIFPGN